MTKEMNARPAGATELDPRRPRLGRNVRVAIRRAPIVVVALLVGTSAALGISKLSKVKYQSKALLVVAGSTNTATGANTLAATYAGLIPEDKGVQQTLASATGITSSTQYTGIGKRLGATVVTNSAIVSLTFTAPTPQQAQTGLHVLVFDLTNGVLQWRRRGQSVAGCTIHLVGGRPQTQPPAVRVAVANAVQYYCPISSAIPLAPTPGYLVMVQDATAGVRSTPRSIKTAALGGALGLLLGLGAAITWERTDPRADSLEDLRSQVECPVWNGRFTPAAAASILDHWRQTVTKGSLQIGTVTVGRCDTLSVNDMQRAIEQAAGHQGVAFRQVDLGGATILEGLDTHIQIVVLCIAQGTPLSRLRETVRRLGELGHIPDWVFLMRRAGHATTLPVAESGNSRPLRPAASEATSNGSGTYAPELRPSPPRPTGVGGGAPNGGKLP